MATALQFRIITAAALVGLAGCAQQAVKPNPQAPVAASSPAAAQATSSSAQQWPDGVSPHILQLARDEGYRPMVSNGHTVFCKSEIPTGSTLPTRRCVNSVSLRFEVLREQQQRQALEQGVPMVGKPGN